MIKTVALCSKSLDSEWHVEVQQHGAAELVQAPSKRLVNSGWYRGTFLIRNNAPLGPYIRTMPRALMRPLGVVLFLMSEVPL